MVLTSIDAQFGHFVSMKKLTSLSLGSGSENEIQDIFFPIYEIYLSLITTSMISYCNICNTFKSANDQNRNALILSLLVGHRSSRTII